MDDVVLRLINLLFSFILTCRDLTNVRLMAVTNHLSGHTI